MRTLPIDMPLAEIDSFCRRHHMVKLSLFGSVLRDDFTSASDIDVLVEFDPEHVPGWKFFSMQDELSEMLGRRVDLNTRNSLSPYFVDEVLQDAEVVYERQGA